MDRHEAQLIVAELHKGSDNTGKWLAAINETLKVGLAEIAKAITQQGKPKIQLGEIRFMFIVPDDQADAAFTIDPGTVTDAEGNAVPASALVVTTVSDNEAVVSIVPGADQLNGSAHFGAPGDAAITATIAATDGTVLGKLGAQFHVTTGNPAAISGGSITFVGLTEAPAA